MRSLIYRRLPVVAAFMLSACTNAGNYDFYAAPPFFTLSGPVEVDVVDTSSRELGAVAWFWDTDQGCGTWVSEAAFKLHISGYVMEIEHPPSAEHLAMSDRAGSLNTGAHEDVNLLFGIPLLLTAQDDSKGTLPKADKELFDAWLRGEEISLDELLPGPLPYATVPVGATWDYLLIHMTSAQEVQRLGDLEQGVAGPNANLLAEVLPGLTLYRRPRLTDQSWLPLAAPGSATEFQEIAMLSVGP